MCASCAVRVASVVTLLCAFCWQVVNGDATVGDFVTMNVYIVQVCLCIWWLHITIWLALTLHLGGLQLFQPLGFLGTIYGAIVDAIEDMRSLTELLGNVRCLPWWRRLATHATLTVFECVCLVSCRSLMFKTYPVPPCCTCGRYCWHARLQLTAPTCLMLTGTSTRHLVPQ